MSENLDRVCAWARRAAENEAEFAGEYGRACDIIDAAYAEFAELERKAEENQRKVYMLDGLWAWLNGYKATTDFSRGIMRDAVVDGELLFRRKVIAKLDSLAKGGTNADDQG